MRVLFHQIPLVHNDNGGFTLFVNETDNFYVLFGKSFRAIYDEHANVATSNGVEGAHIAVIFHVVVYATLFSNPRRVDNGIRLITAIKESVDRVARRTRHGRYDTSFATQKSIDKAGLTRVGLAYYRDL